MKNSLKVLERIAFISAAPNYYRAILPISFYNKKELKLKEIPSIDNPSGKIIRAEKRNSILFSDYKKETSFYTGSINIIPLKKSQVTGHRDYILSTRLETVSPD